MKSHVLTTLGTLVLLSMLSSVPARSEPPTGDSACPWEGRRPSEWTLIEIQYLHDRWLHDPAAGERANLCGADLTGSDLRGADLRGANLQRAKLAGLDLLGIRLKEADLRGADLRGAKIQSGNLKQTDLREAQLQSARVIGSDLRFANAANANFRATQLTNSNLAEADLSDADFEGANLSMANLEASTLRGANLHAANLSAARLMRADLQGTELRGANLSEANLSEAKLAQAQLDGARLVGTNLTGATLTGANLEGALYLPRGAPVVDGLEEIRGIGTLRVHPPEDLHAVPAELQLTSSSAGIRLLRDALLAAGQPRDARIATALIAREMNETRPTWRRWAERFLFDWTSGYGLHPHLPLLRILEVIGVCTLLYLVPLLGIGNAGILRYWREEDVDPIRKEGARRRRWCKQQIVVRGPASALYALLFSASAATRLGKTRINLSLLISRAMGRPYVLRANGWVRTLANLEYALVLYLIMFWGALQMGWLRFG